MNEGIRIFEDRPVVYASFWERFAAGFLDGLILMPLSFIANFFVTGTWLNTSGSWYPSLIGIIIGWLYAALQESSTAQATLGKRAMGIKVTDESGNRISLGRGGSGRHFAKYISMIILFIGYLMMLWDPMKQTLHDKIAGTFVVTQASGNNLAG